MGKGVRHSSEIRPTSMRVRLLIDLVTEFPLERLPSMPPCPSIDLTKVQVWVESWKSLLVMMAPMERQICEEANWFVFHRLRKELASNGLGMTHPHG